MSKENGELTNNNGKGEPVLPRPVKTDIGYYPGANSTRIEERLVVSGNGRRGRLTETYNLATGYIQGHITWLNTEN